jgi:hypothetical protein
MVLHLAKCKQYQRVFSRHETSHPCHGKNRVTGTKSHLLAELHTCVLPGEILTHSENPSNALFRIFVVSFGKPDVIMKSN